MPRCFTADSSQEQLHQAHKVLLPPCTDADRSMTIPERLSAIKVCKGLSLIPLAAAGTPPSTALCTLQVSNASHPAMDRVYQNLRHDYVSFVITILHSLLRSLTVDFLGSILFTAAETVVGEFKQVNLPWLYPNASLSCDSSIVTPRAPLFFRNLDTKS